MTNVIENEVDQTDISVLSLEDSPDLKTGKIMKSVWPEFMTPDRKAMKYWGEMRRQFPDYQLCLCDKNNKVMGLGNSVPISWTGVLDDLPIDWTDTLVRGVENKGKANTLAAVNVAIHPKYQRSGLSQRLLTEFKKLAHRKGVSRMIVPVRPSFKADYP